MNQRVLTVVAAIGVLLWASSEIDAEMEGIFGRSTIGCTGSGCHGSVDSAAVTITPFHVGSNVYEITVDVLEPSVPTDGLNVGGFNLMAAHGQLSPLDLNARVNGSGSEATHTEDGNDQRNWTVRWAPSETTFCSVDFTAAGNAVNGNNLADAGDHWGIAPSVSVTLDTSGDAAPPSVDQVLSPRADRIYVGGGALPVASPVGIVIGNVAIVAKVSDDVALDKVEVFDTDLAGGPESLGLMTHESGGTFRLNWTTTGSEPPGPHTLEIVVTDCAGNVGTASIELVTL